MSYRKKLIEVALPLTAINNASQRENYIYKGNPSAIHKWWAQRPLAAARAVLFAQLVDDPSAWPELFLTEAEQDHERQRLFLIIERLVPWEASHDEAILNVARLEIARSWGRSHPSLKTKLILAEGTKPAEVNDYLASEMPPLHDPFAGGGTIPLEARRLGLRAIATDINPVAVLINKSLIEIPSIFSDTSPVNPESRRIASLRTWQGSQGLADDVRYYGAWIREEAKKRIGHLYPQVQISREMTQGRPDLEGLEGKKLTVIAWLWARTVASPNPAFGGVHVPLVTSFWLSTKQGKKTWVEPVIEEDGKSYRFELRTGQPTNEAVIDAGTKLKGASFRCLLSGAPIEPDYIRAAGRSGQMSACLMAVAAEGERRRVYLAPNDEQANIARTATPAWAPEEILPEKALGFRIQNYGLTRWRDIFTSRQLVALTTFSDLVTAAQGQVVADAEDAGLLSNSCAMRDGGHGRQAYSEAIAIYLSFALNKCIEYCNSLVIWYSKEDRPKGLFTRQSLPMVWDFAEVNPLGDIGGTLSKSVAIVADSIPRSSNKISSIVLQRDATSSQSKEVVIVSTDPPYYDNVPYADLSDFFYIWLRRTLRTVYPELLSTITVPKASELVADPFRHGGREGAESFFLHGMTKAMVALRASTECHTPVTIYYAFKQSETNADAATSSTGWETFLHALIEAGFAITGTWPLRTERSGRTRDIGSNALASSVVLVCRVRPKGASTITRGDFRRELRAELPAALKALQHGNIAPVDVAQASVGPGMAIFSRYAKVLEADGSAMTVRAALQLINEALDEYLSAEEGEADADSRFAITWFEGNGWNAGAYGDAETLAKARNVSVAGIVEAGVAHSAAGKVRLLKRSELPGDWDPATDNRLTVWEATQHLIKRLDEQGETSAAALLKQLGPLADHARDLAYRLYNACERRKWAEDALAYNGLVIAWPELEKLAGSMAVPAPVPQGGFEFGEGPPPKAPKKAKKKV